MGVRSSLIKYRNKLDVEYWRVGRLYHKSLSALELQRNPETSIAVVIHLYYVEAWPLFAKSLRVLDGQKFDLFVSLQTKDIAYGENVLDNFPAAYVIETPNHGRDILPFMKIATVIDKAGYKTILKLHSKKSPHRTDGSDWLSDMTSCLLSSNKSTLKQVLHTLETPNTGVIGPRDQYLALSVNFEANGINMTKILNKLYDKKTSYRVLQSERSAYGFFAGSMFWARIDAIRPLLQFDIADFDPEKGQIDGTFAHAFERIVSLVSEIDNRKLYEVDQQKIRLVEYNSGVTPDWSNVYIGPKAADQ